MANNGMLKVTIKTFMLTVVKVKKLTLRLRPEQPGPSWCSNTCGYRCRSRTRLDSHPRLQNKYNFKFLTLLASQNPF
jgi:hypothetical protein